MSEYRKKPVVIEAVQWTGSEGGEIDDWLTDADHRIVSLGSNEPEDGEVWDEYAPVSLFIKTLEGVHEARPGDWIIRGVQGELYPCKPDIFAQTYEPVGEPPDPTPCEHEYEPYSSVDKDRLKCLRCGATALRPGPPDPRNDPTTHAFSQPCGQMEGTDHCWLCGKGRTKHKGESPTPTPTDPRLMYGAGVAAILLEKALAMVNDAGFVVVSRADIEALRNEHDYTEGMGFAPGDYRPGVIVKGVLDAVLNLAAREESE